jgi:hypothetical protein
MTTLLTAAKVDFARSVKNSSAVLIVLMLINQEHPGHSTTADEIRDIIEMDTRTITNHLRSLSARNLALFDGTGYVLVEENAMILSQPTLALSPALEQALVLEAQTVENSVIEENSNTHSVRSLVVEDSSLLKVKNDSSSTTYIDTQAAQKLSAAQVFQASRFLFDEIVFQLAGISTARVLSVFAHVYDMQNARTPARLAWSMLKNVKETRQEYIDAPWGYFPDAFLEALGIARYECTACGSADVYATRTELAAHVQEKHPQMTICPTCMARFENNAALDAHFAEQHEPKVARADETIATVLPDTRLTAESAWEMVKEQLREELPRANYDTWVNGSRAVRYDENVLTVGTRNIYSADWLTNRVTARALRVLNELQLLSAIERIEFVVAEVE